MRINATNPVFVAVFAIIVIGTVGFLIASIFIKPGEKSSDDKELIQRISFQRSDFAIDIRRQQNDTQYMLQVFNGLSLYFTLLYHFTSFPLFHFITLPLFHFITLPLYHFYIYFYSKREKRVK
jgi:hypothetical protein